MTRPDFSIEQLNELEEKYRSFFDSSRDGIVITSITGYFNEFNAAFIDMLGYSEEELHNLRFIDILPEKEYNHFESVLSNQLMVQGYSQDYESELIKKNRELIYVSIKLWLRTDQRGNILSIWALINDISLRKEAERKTKESEEKHRILFETSPFSIILIDSDYIIRGCNPITESLLDYKHNEMVGKSFRDLFGSTIFSIIKNLIESLKCGEKVEPVEILIQKKAAHSLWISLTPSSVRANNITLFQIIIQDISARKEIEQLKNELTKTLEEKVVERTKKLQKVLETQELYLDEILKSSQIKSEFMATMSHELRTPLNAIIGFTDLLLEEAYGELNVYQLEFLKDIQTSAKHQFNMIKQVLSITKIDSGQLILKKQEFHLASIIEQARSLLMPDYKEKGLEFTVKGLDKEKKIFADPLRFKEILLNLFSNAINYTERGKIEFIITEQKSYWEFIIKDTGIGIAEQDFDLIFKEFKRVNSPYVNSMPGTGLGLPLTKRLINMHGGDISFVSHLGVGSAFKFTIPKRIKAHRI